MKRRDKDDEEMLLRAHRRTRAQKYATHSELQAYFCFLFLAELVIMKVSESFCTLGIFIACLSNHN